MMTARQRRCDVPKGTMTAIALTEMVIVVGRAEKAASDKMATRVTEALVEHTSLTEAPVEQVEHTSSD